MVNPSNVQEVRIWDISQFGKDKPYVVLELESKSRVSGVTALGCCEHEDQAIAYATQPYCAGRVLHIAKVIYQTEIRQKPIEYDRKVTKF